MSDIPSSSTWNMVCLRPNLKDGLLLLIFLAPIHTHIHRRTYTHNVDSLGYTHTQSHTCLQSCLRTCTHTITQTAFQTEGKLYLVLEFLRGGDLFTRLSKEVSERLPIHTISVLVLSVDVW